MDRRRASEVGRSRQWLEELVSDLRFGTRTLLHNPGFAALAVLTLGLGIGANTAIFSVIDGVLLKPLPYENADRLLLVRHSAPLANQRNPGVSIRELYDYREQLTGLEELVEFHQMNFDLLRQGEPDRVATGVVSANFFEVLGIRPLLGRGFVPADDDEGGEAVLVLGHSYWQTKFGGDRQVVGRVLEMNDRPHTVVGVLPPVPHYPNEVDVYMPTSACPFRTAAGHRSGQFRRIFSTLQVFGLLKPGVPPRATAAEVAAVGERFVRDHPQVYRPERTGFQARTAEVLAEMTGQARPMLIILLGTTGLVLLMACANVANLSLARMLRRDRELAMRTALGAGRGRLVRQLLTESLLLAVAGGAVGLVFAWSTLDLLTAFVGRFTARTGEIALDAGVLGTTLALSLATGILFGTFPALAARGDLVSAMKAGGRSAIEGGGRSRLQAALVVPQVAVSVVVLVGAGLLLMSYYRLQRVDPGYQADRVLSAEIFGNFTKYPNALALRQLYVAVLERLEAAPGVLSAAITNGVPLSGFEPFQTRFEIAGRTDDSPELAPTADVRVASPAYFDTLGIPVLRGRAFGELDHEQAPRVVVINESMVRYWDGRDPLGSEVAIATDAGKLWSTVVGVVRDVKAFGLDREAVAQVYLPLRQANGLQGRAVVRMAGDARDGAAVIRQAVQAVDPDLPIENVRTMAELREGSLARPRLTATLLSVFGALALLVTVTGITGVIATSVSQRRQEFGVRMALGAGRATVLAMVLRQGLLLVALGLAAGVAAALALARVLRSYLFDTAPNDPVAFLLVAVAFTAAGLLATLGPAWRATRVDPMVALRAE